MSLICIPALFACNNQFYFEVKKQACVVVSLMQKYRLMGEDRSFVPCGCSVYQVWVCYYLRGNFPSAFVPGDMYVHGEWEDQQVPQENNIYIEHPSNKRRGNNL